MLSENVSITVVTKKTIISYVWIVNLKKKSNVEFQNLPRKVIRNSKGEVVSKEFFFKESMMLNWNFQRGLGVQVMDIF